MPGTYGQPKKPLVAAVDTHGTPIRPEWKTQPDEVIGHFGVQYFGIKVEVDRPQSRRIGFKQSMKWRGFKHYPCFIWLTPVADGSGGYFFHCMESPFGPRGWIYPIPKRGPEDKTLPWAVFFDQQ